MQTHLAVIDQTQLRPAILDSKEHDIAWMGVTYAAVAKRVESAPSEETNRFCPAATEFSSVPLKQPSTRI